MDNYYDKKILNIPSIPSDANKAKIIENTKSISTLPVRNRSADSKSFVVDNFESWLLGRRVCFGYTLCSGKAFRNQALRFKLEGLKTEDGNHIFKSMHGKKTAKFSAGYLLFECQAPHLTTHSKGQLLNGRLPNLLCNFLLLLIQENFISLHGHVAYDLGDIGSFQDIPLSLQIIAHRQFFQLMNGVHGNDSSSRVGEQETGYSIFKGSDSNNHLRLREACNDLMIWLCEGEKVLMSVKQKEKLYIEKIQHQQQQQQHAESAGEDDDTMIDQAIDKANDEMLLSQGDNVSDSLRSVVNTDNIKSELQSLQQPDILVNVEMKRYQLQALFWMAKREKDVITSGEKMTGANNDNSTSLSLPNSSSHPAFELADGSIISNVVVPIEGAVTATYNQLACIQLDLWQQLLCIRVQSQPRTADGQFATPTGANYYTSEDVLNLLHANTWNRYTQVLQDAPPIRPKSCKGGILADDMGLGKTIMALSVIASDYLDSLETKNIESNIPDIADVGEKAENHHSEEFNQEQLKKKRKLEKKDSDRCCHATLIVCPMSLLGQWVDEIQKKMKPHTIAVHMHYGGTRSKYNFKHRFGIRDIVVTTYGVVTAEWKKYKNSLDESFGGNWLVFQNRWRRVILDEAHIIRNRLTDVAKSCYAIQAERKWILTGTPIQNSVDDLFSLMVFLQHEPWCEWRWWQKTVSETMQSNPAKAMNTLREVLGQIMLRRIKSSIDITTGKSIVDLPPRVVETILVDLDCSERSFYEILASRSSILMRDTENKRVGGYAALFTLLMRLRQTCDHPVLVLQGLGMSKSMSSTENVQSTRCAESKVGTDHEVQRHGEKAYLQQVLRKFDAYIQQQQESVDVDVDNDVSIEKTEEIEENMLDQECPMCLEILHSRSCCVTPCGHILCWECAKLSIEKSQRCPTCREDVTLKQLLSLSGHGESSQEKLQAFLFKNPPPTPRIPSIYFGRTSSLPPATSNEDILLEISSRRSSSKIEKLIEFLKEILNNSSTDDVQDIDEMSSVHQATHKKVVIFSQWIGMLNLVEKSIIEDIVMQQAGHASKHPLKIVRFDGTMNQSQRGEVLRKFNDDPHTRILLITLKAGGVGLNLTAASIVVMMDPWWNPAVEDQAIDRVHRLGQTRMVRIIRMICTNTVEEKLVDLQESKRFLCNQAIGQGFQQVASDGNKNKLTLENLKELFRR